MLFKKVTRELKQCIAKTSDYVLPLIRYVNYPSVWNAEQNHEKVAKCQREDVPEMFTETTQRRRDEIVGEGSKVK